MKHLIPLLFLSGVLCFNFDTKRVKVIHVRGSNSAYFGYALLLQKGSAGLPPTVIVGAPGQGLGRSGGSVYSCTVEGTCKKYSFKVNNDHSMNGNFLGSVFDGGEKAGDWFITCAPRVVEVTRDHHYLFGWCLRQINSSNVNGFYSDIKPLKDESAISQDRNSGSYFYDFAFGESGFDVEYVQESNSFIFGAPGVKNWNGALVTYMSGKKQSVIPEKRTPILKENFEYLGYKVTTARFEPNRKMVYYVTGSPRANNLFGHVKIFNNAGRLLTTLGGDEIGSFYGSSILAVDLNNDLRDDILVGAPTGAGGTWEEGYVYFYRREESKLAHPVRLLGNKKVGARFGSSIVSLGDIDLDSYKDVAISAPFEDDGVGAVYIYMGSRTGVQPIYSQRLSPLEFPGNFQNVRGFGQGLSKGVDIDNNGHNDLAIGAYRSDRVFVMSTLSVIDFKLTLEPNVTSISGTGLKVTFCVYYTQRSPAKDMNILPFKINLRLDYRTNGQVEGEKDFPYTLNVTVGRSHCETLDVVVQKSPLDITPFKLYLKSEILQGGIVGKGESEIEKSIPYSHGCGDDNICQTAILIEPLSNLQEIILGKNKEIMVNVSAENVGEPGYACELYMNFSTVLELRDTRDCNMENSTYVCPFSNRLEHVKKEVSFKFDIKLTKPELDRVKFNFEVKCLGENSPPDANKRALELEVKLRNSPYIQGSSTPTNFYFTDENLEKDVEVSHKFRIGNTGPSPVKLDVFLALPTIKMDEIDIFDIDAQMSLNEIEFQCNVTNKTFKPEQTYNVTTLLTEPINKTVVIDCFEENMDCLILFCDGNYLYKSTEIAEYKIKITTKTKLLATHFRNELLKKNILAYVSSAYIFNSTNRVEGHTSTLIFASKSNPVPLWVYIVALIVGILLLALLVFILYRCHFFDRNYRDKLNDEKLMDQRSDDSMDSTSEMDAVDLQQLPMCFTL